VDLKDLRRLVDLKDLRRLVDLKDRRTRKNNKFLVKTRGRRKKEETNNGKNIKRLVITRHRLRLSQLPSHPWHRSQHLHLVKMVEEVLHTPFLETQTGISRN
jgi:hypothetical protein